MHTFLTEQKHFFRHGRRSNREVNFFLTRVYFQRVYLSQVPLLV